MVRIKGFSNYFLCKDTVGIYTRKGREYVLLLPTPKIKRKTCYILHENGVPHVVSFRKIIEENWHLPEVSSGRSPETSH